MSEFDRVYKLTAIRAPETGEIEGLGRSFFEELETITEITQLQIKFKVEKHLRSRPNSAEITIVNLAASSRDDFLRVPQRIRLEAGYDDTPRLLFIGDLRHASNEHVGTEWLTKLQLADGGRAYAKARVNRSYAKGTPFSSVITEIAKAFGVPAPSLPPELQSRLSAGEVITGAASKALTRLLAPYGFEWSFQDERLQVLRVDGVQPGTIRVLSEEDGLIGTPVIAPPKIQAETGAHRAGEAPRVPKATVKHLLYPEITPGEQLGVQSRSVSGGFRADVVTHEGDLFGEDWTTTVEATAI